MVGGICARIEEQRPVEDNKESEEGQSKKKAKRDKKDTKKEVAATFRQHTDVCWC